MNNPQNNKQDNSQTTPSDKARAEADKNKQLGTNKPETKKPEANDKSQDTNKTSKAS